MADSDAVAALRTDLERIFAGRLRSLILYGERRRTAKAPITSLAIVDHLSPADLQACATRVQAWHSASLATPLLLGEDEFARSLDAFPFEFGAILNDYTVAFGTDALQGLTVAPADLRRACEVQLRSHLLHLREAFIETRGRGSSVAALVQRSAAPLAALLRHISHLDGSSPINGVLTRIAEMDATTTLRDDEALTLFPEYVSALEQLTGAIDRWDHG